jgi:hypothetical protein
MIVLLPYTAATPIFARDRKENAMLPDKHIPVSFVFISIKYRYFCNYILSVIVYFITEKYIERMLDLPEPLHPDSFYLSQTS